MAVKLVYTKGGTTNRFVYPAYQDFTVQMYGGQGQTYIYGVGFVSPVNHKYKLDVKINGNLVISLKKTPDSNKRAWFHLEKIFQDFCKTDDSEWYLNTNTDRTQIHQISDFTRNLTNLIEVELIAGEQYELNNVLYDTTTTLASQTQTYGINEKFYVYNGTRQHQDGEYYDVDIFAMDGDGLTLSEFTHQNTLGSTALASVLSNRNVLGAKVNKLRLSDYHTIAFFNQNTDNLTNEPSKIRVIRYDENGSTIGSAVTDDNFLQPNTTMTQDRGLIYYGVGPKNLVANGILTQSEMDASSFYRVDFRNSGNTATKSTALWFQIEDEDCKGFETIRLAWVNKNGGWDYYNFTKRSTQTSSSKRTLFEKNYGFFQNSNTDGYDYNSNQGGNQVLNNNVTEQIEANTSYIKEDEALVLKSLFTSPNVQMQNADGNYERVIVTEKDYVKQTSANDKLIQYVITVEKSHYYRVQREG